MASSVEGYRDVRQCPYNPAHQILSHRFQTHLVKCKKAYPDIILKVCPFNSTHHVNEVEYQGHVKDCPDRINLEIYQHTLDVGNKYEDPNEPPQLYDEVKGAENWDDCNDASYNPADTLEASGVMLNRSYVGLKPAQKKRLREEEILRAHSKLKTEDDKSSRHRRKHLKSHKSERDRLHRRENSSDSD